MTAGALVVFLAALTAAALYATWIYRRRELAVSGSTFLSIVRALVLGLVVLLLLNPTLPWGRNGIAQGDWVLVDGSTSLSAGPSSEETPWERAKERASDAASRGARVVEFGDRPEVLDPGAIESRQPVQTRSRLTRGVELAAEAGAASALVVTDLRVSDLAEALARAQTLGMRLTFDDVGEEVVNVGVLELEIPASVEATDTFSVGVTLFGEGPASDSVSIEVRREGALVAATRTLLPGPGATRSLRVGLPPPGTEEPGRGGVRYTVRATLPGDMFSPDDERVGYVRTDRDIGGLVLVSDAPDWEPRFLLPVLAQVSGLGGTAYLRLGSGRWREARVGEPAAGEIVDEATVVGRMGSAEMLVLHGVTGTSPEWLSTAATSAARVLLFPGDEDGMALLGVAGRPPASGEWYPVSPPPPSPVAGQLADARFADLPPLTSVQPLSDEVGRTVLSARMGNAGVTRPVLLVVESQGRRTAVSVAAGFWRWALRGGEGMNAYRRIWSGIVGWLLAGERAVSSGDVRPARTVVAVGNPVTWLAPGRAGDTLSVQLVSPGAPADTTVQVLPGQRFRTHAPAPGTHVYRVTDAQGNSVGSGRLEIDAWSGELLTLPGSPDSVAAEAGATSARLQAGIRLRTHPAPYLLLIALLAIEWVGRRRRGLR